MAVPARHIRTAGGKVLDVLDRAGLRGLATGTVAAVLAELYVDLRVLRPFQTGNDEATQVFLSELADDAGYRIDWAAVPPAALTAACDTGDPDPLRVVRQGAVQHIDTTGTGAGRKRREVHALADTLREVADQLRPPTDPAPPG
jgi:fido (protein-threonine AMPylation protein)